MTELVLVLATMLVGAVFILLLPPRLMALIGVPICVCVPSSVQLGGLPIAITPLRALGAVVLAKSVAEGTRIFGVPRLNTRPAIILKAAVFLWIVVAILVFALRPHREFADSQFLGLTLDVLLPAWLLGCFIRSARDTALVVNSLVAVSSAASAVAVLEGTLNRHLINVSANFAAPDRYGRVRAQGLFAHPILLGVIAGATVVVCFALWLDRGRSVARRRSLGAAIFLNLLAVYFSSSRAGYLCVVLGCAAVVALNFRVRLRVLVAALATMGAATLFLLPTTVSEATGGGGARVVDSEEGASIAYRSALLSASTQYIARHPYGYGFGSFKGQTNISGVFQGRRFDFATSLDNAFAWAGIRYGLVSIFLLAMVAVAIPWAGAYALRRASDRTHGWCYLAGLEGVSFAMAGVLTSIALFSFPQGTLFFVVLATTLFATANPRRAASTQLALGRTMSG